MNTKIVFQLDANGIYLGETIADESPLEPGVFLIPAGCVEEAPPTAGYNQVQRWNGKKWMVEEAAQVVDQSLAPIDPADAERAWRFGELVRADNEIRKHEDGDATATATEQAWREYRVSLRDWPQSAQFPDEAHRPSAPA